MESNTNKHSEILHNYKIENASLAQAVEKIERDVEKRKIELSELKEINQEINEKNLYSNSSSYIDNDGIDNYNKLKLSKYPNYFK